MAQRDSKRSNGKKKSAAPSRDKPKSKPAATAPAAPSSDGGDGKPGLEALQQFLGHVPESSGLAFVVVQHLDASQSFEAELPASNGERLHTSVSLVAGPDELVVLLEERA